MAHHLFSESDYPIYACNMQHMTYDGAATFTQFWLVCFTGDWICPCRYLDFLVWPFCICQTQSFTFACFGAGVLDFSRNKFCIFHVQSSTFSDRWHPHLSEFLVWLVIVCFVNFDWFALLEIGFVPNPKKVLMGPRVPKRGPILEQWRRLQSVKENPSNLLSLLLEPNYLSSVAPLYSDTWIIKQIVHCICLIFI